MNLSNKEFLTKSLIGALILSIIVIVFWFVGYHIQVLIPMTFVVDTWVVFANKRIQGLPNEQFYRVILFVIGAIASLTLWYCIDSIKLL